MAPVVFFVAKFFGSDLEQEEEFNNYDNFLKVLNEYHPLHHLFIMYSTSVAMLHVSPFVKPQSTLDFSIIITPLYVPNIDDCVSLFDGHNPVLAFSALLWGIMSLLEGRGVYTWGLGAPFGQWWAWFGAWLALAVVCSPYI